MQAQEQLASQPSVAQQIENAYGPTYAPSASFSSVALPMNEATKSSYTTTAQGNTLTALPTPGTAGLSMMPLAGQNNVGNIGQMYPLTTTQGTNQYTNTAQTSSNNQPFFLFNPAFYEAVPGYIASTTGSLVNWALTPYGFTPGGAPLAGGQFPNNYPFTQEGINP